MDIVLCVQSSRIIPKVGGIHIDIFSSTLVDNNSAYLNNVFVEIGSNFVYHLVFSLLTKLKLSRSENTQSSHE